MGFWVFSFFFAVKDLGVNTPTLFWQKEMSKMAPVTPECVHRARGSGACECRVFIACSSLYLVLLIIRSCIIVIIAVVADSSAHSSCTATALPPYTFCNSFSATQTLKQTRCIFYPIFSREICFLKPAASECKFQTSKQPKPQP